MSVETAPQSAKSGGRSDRITRWLLIAIGIYSGLLVALLNAFILSSGKVEDRAILLMADGMILFIAWAWMLSRWAFSPLKVLLLFGITGSMAEASINPTSLIGGFWVFVYGLMVYLPACTVPGDRPATPPRWWHYPLAVVLPFPFVVFAAPMILLREWLGIKFLPGV